jgi:hypothetical protein
MKRYLNWIKSVAITLFSTIVLLLILNIPVVYFSPTLIHKLGGVGVSKLKIERCYRTFVFDNLTANESSKEKVVVIGDSYSEGMGDEFLANDDNFGLIRKLDTEGVDYIVAGRSAYGSLGAYNEVSACLPFLDKWTSWNYDKNKVSKVLMMFYEGNDLNNNLVEFDHMSFEEDLSAERKLELLFPIFQSIQTIVRQIKYKLKGPKAIEKMAVNITKYGVEIPIFVQSAAAELSDGQLDKSLGFVDEVLKKLRQKFSNASIELLYIPSVASSYEFKMIKIQTYQGGSNLVSEEENYSRSKFIRKELKEYCDNVAGCGFCDPTEKIRSYTSSENAIHGPRDWKHFNKKGYELVKSEYLRCFSSD